MGAIMQTSKAGVDLIKKFEGRRLAAYRCPAGVWTIGYGHTTDAGSPKVVPGMVISATQADEILKQDLRQYEEGVTRLLKVSVTQGQFDALVSFAYNCGVGALQKSTLLKKINADRHANVPAEFMKWTRAAGKELPGLVRRRRAEAALWRGLDESATGDDAQRMRPEPPPAKTITQSKEANTAAAVATGGAAALIAEVAPLAREGASILTAFAEALGRPAVIGLVVAMLAAGAIWFWRKRRLEETGA
jgi:lysozyme